MARSNSTVCGVRFLDLTDSFQGVEESIYADSCCHINEAGNRILGERIARFVVDEWD